MSEASENDPSDIPRVPPAAATAWPQVLLPISTFPVLDLVMRTLVPRPGRPHLYSLNEASERAGITSDDVGRLWRALGFAELAEDSPEYTAADVEAFGEVARLAADGVIDLDLAISMARPMGHLLSRLGAAQVSALSGLVASGATDRRRGHGIDENAGGALIPLLERLVVYAWRHHLTAAASAALPMGQLDEAGAPSAVGFIDIASYTTLSRRIDWGELASLLDRFEACAFDHVGALGGRVVKTLGDEILFVAGDPATAAEIALCVMEARQADSHLPPMHAGLAYGPLLKRAGDVFGPTVNIASRITGLARAGSVLVDDAYRSALENDLRFQLRRRPRRRVRGYARMATYRLSRTVPPHAR